MLPHLARCELDLQLGDLDELAVVVPRLLHELCPLDLLHDLVLDRLSIRDLLFSHCLVQDGGLGNLGHLPLRCRLRLAVAIFNPLYWRLDLVRTFTAVLMTM